MSVMDVAMTSSCGRSVDLSPMFSALSLTMSPPPALLSASPSKPSCSSKYTSLRSAGFTVVPACVVVVTREPPPYFSCPPSSLKNVSSLPTLPSSVCMMDA